MHNSIKVPSTLPLKLISKKQKTRICEGKGAGEGVRASVYFELSYVVCPISYDSCC